MLKFADDTKVFRNYFNKLPKWSEKGQMLFLILESVSASTQDMGMKMHNIQWVVLY